MLEEVFKQLPMLEMEERYNQIEMGYIEAHRFLLAEKNRKIRLQRKREKLVEKKRLEKEKLLAQFDKWRAEGVKFDY